MTPHPPPKPGRRPKPGYGPWRTTFPWFGTSLFVIAGLICGGLIMPPLMCSRDAAPRSSCKNNLKQIMLALHNYHDIYDSFPPAYVVDKTGKPIHIWRVLILPQMERRDLYERYRFDEPWDGPNNRKLHDEIVSVYRCQSEENGREGETSYVVVVGPRTAFPGSRCVTMKEIAAKDGTSNVITVVEYRNSGIHWMEPRDLEFGNMAKTLNAGHAPSISSPHPGGAYVALADGSVRFLSDELSAETLMRLLLIDDGNPNTEW